VIRIPLVARRPTPQVLADDAQPMLSQATPPEREVDRIDPHDIDLPKQDAASDQSAVAVAKPKMAESKTAEPTLSEPKAETGLIDFGVAANDLPAMRGALVANVVSDSPADSAGIKKGDRIVSINGRLLMDSAALNRQLDGRTAGEQFTIQLVRDAKLIAAEVQYNTAEANALAKSDAEKAKATGGGDSITGGIGSMLGGLFGSKKAIPSASDDEMAFDDAEPIQPVTFEAPAKKDAPAKPAKKSDPPSLELMELPAGNAEPAKDTSKQQLRSRIDALEAELNQLKADAE
jgi:membrane-associated protease RseP (regulator of RpoE activity)